MSPKCGFQADYHTIPINTGYFSKSAKFQKAMAPQSKDSYTTISRDPGPRWDLGEPSQVARVEEWGPRGRDSVLHEKHWEKQSQEKAVLREVPEEGRHRSGGRGGFCFIFEGGSIHGHR